MFNYTAKEKDETLDKAVWINRQCVILLDLKK